LDAGSVFPSIEAAMERLTALRSSPLLSSQLRSSPPHVTLWVSGVCHLSDTLALSGAQGSNLSVRRYSAAAGSLRSSPLPSDQAVVSGGTPIDASWFSAVTDPTILAQLPAAARGQVSQVSLNAHGIILTNDQITWPCLPYVGANAAINLFTLLPSPVELFWGPNASAATPLTYARFPNDGPYKQAWVPIVSTPNSTDNMWFEGTQAVQARMSSWSNQLSSDISSIQVKMFTVSDGWATQVTPLTAYGLPKGGNNGTLRGDYCQSYPSGAQVPGVGGIFYLSNVLAELDVPGEYYFNRTSSILYVWPPTPITTGPMGYLSLGADILQLNDVSDVSFEGIDFRFGRGAGVNLNNSTNVNLAGITVHDVGNMGINVTGGSNVIISNASVQYAGNGGINMYAGDRTTLTPSGHVIDASSISYYNRHQICYVPGVAFGGVGNTLSNSEVSNAPHQAIFICGNNHNIVGNTIHDVVQITDDSGAIYMGRDWTYRGNQIVQNTFRDINTVFNSQNDVQAVYLDDMVSGFNVSYNTFINVSRSYHLGGGRNNIFTYNTIINGSDNSEGDAVHADNRGMGWDSSACQQPDGILVQFLSVVPYNTSQIWIQSYPDLPNILQDEACQAKYNIMENNTACGLPPNVVFTIVSQSTFASWGSTMANDTVTPSCNKGLN
jgi:hypothetical protein